MKSDSHSHPGNETHAQWHGPRWAFAVLLASLGLLGPLSVDTYLPAFAGIAQDLGANRLQLQQTLSAYLFSFGVMCLFHGALSDSLGRKPMVLGGLVLYVGASVGCALASDVGQLILCRGLQGLSTGACIVIARAIPRDMYPPAHAQQVMSQVTIFFGIATGFAPLLGGLLFVGWGWRSVFWFLAGFGFVMVFIVLRLLPETLPPAKRHSFRPAHLLRGYWTLGRDARVLLLALAAGVPINGTFVYILSAPVFLGQHLGMQPTQFFWFFLCTISGVMIGAFFSGRLAGRISPRQQVHLGFGVMLVATGFNLLGNMVWAARVPWAFVPPSVYCCGWAIMQPALTLLLLDLHPDRRGMASSLQIFIGSMANSFAAGVAAPLAMGSTRHLALASAGFLGVSLLTWILVRRLWPGLGQSLPPERSVQDLPDGV